MTRSQLRSVLLLATMGVALVMPSITTAQEAKPAKVTRQSADWAPMAISGNATGRACLGNDGLNVHPVGHFPANSRIIVDFVSDFDPIAALFLLQMGFEVPGTDLGRARQQVDDDSGGNLEPNLNYLLPHGGNVVLMVGKALTAGRSGCYFYQVRVSTP